MSIIWDPPRDLFSLPFTHHEVRIYGILFAFGVWLTWILVRRGLIQLFVEKGESAEDGKVRANRLLDKLTWLSVVLLIFGARLFHLLFYDLDYFLYDPLSLFRIWEPGLASHGGTAGLFVAIGIFWWRCRKDFLGASFLEFFDKFAPPVAIAATFIRLGNFFNQEILGKATTLPWGVLFLHPVDGGEVVPRHPVQLYEAFFYLSSFFILALLARKKRTPGFIAGVFFCLIFGGRMILETWKESQSGLFDGGWFSTGQLLSLPLFLFGLFLVLRGSLFSKEPIEDR